MNNNFWNEALRKGVVLGGLLGLSAVIENMIQLSGNASLYMLLVVEFIAVAVDRKSTRLNSSHWS